MKKNTNLIWYLMMTTEEAFNFKKEYISYRDTDSFISLLNEPLRYKHNFAKFLSVTFPFTQSRQGAEYWRNILKKYQNRKPYHNSIVHSITFNNNVNVNK